MLAEAHRREMLSAMGVDVYVLRDAVAVPEPSESGKDWLVVVSAEMRQSPQCAQLRKMLPTIVGIPTERIRWIDAGAPNIPRGSAYLVLGAALARSFGANVPSAQQQAAVIAVADEPSKSFASGVAKRALWQSLKPIARRAREVAAW